MLGLLIVCVCVRERQTDRQTERVCVCVCVHMCVCVCVSKSPVSWLQCHTCPGWLAEMKRAAWVRNRTNAQAAADMPRSGTASLLLSSTAPSVWPGCVRSVTLKYMVVWPADQDNAVEPPSMGPSCVTCNTHNMFHATVFTCLKSLLPVLSCV